jgi:hypothetical protein
MTVEIAIERGDVTDVASDLLLLKYARSFHGADEKVALRLIQRSVCSEGDISPAPGECALVETHGVVAPKRVLFLGTSRLGSFRYKEMRQFAQRAIEVVAQKALKVHTLSVTVHGAGYGLDIEESLQGMLFGFQQGLAAAGSIPLERVLFVERDSRRFDVLAAALRDIKFITPPSKPSAVAAQLPAEHRVSEPSRKKYVFVAMPFQEDFDDVYQFGIYSAVRACGYVCEKVDESLFAGNIVERITEGIRNAEFVIADLTHERPNVYLEVGFAWGLNRPVILVAREGQRLHFDLSHHKCIFYRTIGRLANDLERTIRDIYGLGSSSPK